MTTNIAARGPRGGNKFRLTLIITALSAALLATFALSQFLTSDEESALPVGGGATQSGIAAPADVVTRTDGAQYFGGYGAELTIEDARRIASEQMKSNGITVPGGETIDTSVGPSFIHIATADEAAAAYAEYIEHARALDGSTPIDARLAVDNLIFDCSSVIGPISC
jgi:hypothetical protein